MQRLLALARYPLLLLAVCASGCMLFNPIISPTTGKILQPTLMPPGTVALEVISISLPPDNPDLAARVWKEVDEQDFPVEVRRQWEKNGFRAGTLAGQIPPALSQLLDFKGKPAAAGEVQHVNIVDLAVPARVTTEHMQTHSGQRYEIAASSVLDKMPILASEAGEIYGQTYEQAQGIFALHVTPLPDGRVELELVPEVHHGQAREHWVLDQKYSRMETGRPKRAFDELKLTATLGPGAMLLLGSQPHRQGSLGHYFFLQNNGRDDRLEGKLILVRVCQTQHNDLVTPGPLSIK
jgi:hypothetical protein